MSKTTSARNERLLNELKAREGNNVCADCGTKQSRWASWSLGIWLCVKCATIHRRMGTHISKVKSLSLDIWTKEQVESMRDNGNIKSNALYNPNPERHPPPLDLESEHAESALERYIFQKYRDKAFMEKPKKSSRVNGEPSPTALAAASRSVPTAVTTSREYAASSKAQTGASPSVRTPAVSMSSPQSTEVPVQRVSATPSAHQTQSTHLAAAAASTGRAMTAPLPDPSTRALSPSTPSANSPGYNPFLRQMTASAQIPTGTSITSQATGTGYMPSASPYQISMGSSYLQSNFSTSLNTSPMYCPSMTAQAAPAVPKGEVWDDMASLSLSSNQANLQHFYNGYGKQPAMHMLNTNPFLQSTGMPYKSPSQISSMSSGSSFSSVGSSLSGVSALSPQHTTAGNQASHMPTYQYHAQSSIVPMGMQYNPNVQQQQQQMPTMMQPGMLQQQSFPQFHASNPYSTQLGHVQQPYPQYIQNQNQSQGMH